MMWSGARSSVENRGERRVVYVGGVGGGGGVLLEMEMVWGRVGSIYTLFPS